MKIILSTCKLRSFTLEDAPSLAFHANNINIAKFLRDGFPHPYNTNDAITFIKNTQQTKHCHFAIEVNGEVCGVIGLIYHHTNIKEAELGFWLGEKYWGKGIITEAVKGIVKHGFEVMELNRIYSSCFVDNYGSKRVHEKVGFTYLGTAKICHNKYKNTNSLQFELLKD